MPNHVTNILYAEEQLLGALLNEEGEIDFGTVLPVPDIDDPIFTAERDEYKQPDGEVLYGYGIIGYSPLDWARDNWGTKWNAYRQKVSLKEKCLSFETAWNSPLPVFLKLSELFPKERMVIAYADEDTGFNLGLYELEGGCISRFLPINEGSDEAVGLAEAIKRISERIGERKPLCSTEESLYENPIQLLEVNGVLGGDKENE